MWELSGGLIPTARAVIDINRPCNAKCVMCYYSYDSGDWSKSYEQVVQELSAAKARGNNSVDFTGGEPTIHPEMERVVRTAETMGLHTCIITNGLALEKVKRLTDAGCSEWLVSLHGFEGGHDRLLGVPRAWEKVNRTIDHLNDVGAFVRVNCTLTRYNAKDLPRLARHYIDHVRPRIVNFINFNPHYQWGNSDQPEIFRRLNEVQVKGSEVSDYLKDAVDLLREHNVWVNVRYFPFCLIKGYEAHICNNPQVMFDPYEWDYGVEPKTPEMYLRYARDLQARIGSSEGRCGACGILNVCGGIHKNYAKLHGYDELEPYAERSDYPYHFRTDLMSDIIIPAYRPNANLQKLLGEIAEKTVQPYRLHVVGVQQSAARNRNAGLSASSGPYVIMCDDDVCHLPIAWNRRLVMLLKENPGLLAVSARLMNPDGSVGRNTANNFNLNEPIVRVDMIPTACCIFRKTAVEFDERFVRAGWEDTDFFMQMKRDFSGDFAISNEIRVVHLNEEKNNGGVHNEHNSRLFLEKWGGTSSREVSPLSPMPKTSPLLPVEVEDMLRRQDYDGAVFFAQKASRRDGDDSALSRVLALELHRRGESERALRCLYQALLVNPGKGHLFKSFVSISRECGNYSILEAYLRMVTTQQPNLKDCALLLAECLTLQGKHSGARDVLKRLLARDPDSAAAAELLRQVEVRLGAGSVSGGVSSCEPVGGVNLRDFNALRFMTRRGCVDVGGVGDSDPLLCHRFEDRKARRYRSKGEIVDRIKHDREEYDLVVTDLTGGEPTLHPDIVEIVACGERLGNRICVISQGQWKNMRRMEAIVDAGVHEFLLSIHGVREDHDEATHAGAFDGIMQSIEFLERKRVRWRADCVVHKKNMARLPDYARMLRDLSHRPANVNFIVFSPLSTAQGHAEADLQAMHSELAPHLDEALEILDAALIWPNVRYYPMCMLPGRERHITCLPQICYDPMEWDCRSHSNMDADTIRSIYELGVSRGVYGETSRHVFHNTWSILQSQKLYRKGPTCLECSLRLICDGVAEQYRRRYGFGELSARKGELILDPIHFRRDRPEAVGVRK